MAAMAPRSVTGSVNSPWETFPANSGFLATMKMVPAVAWSKTVF